MEKINKIIDSLSPVEQLIMCNALQKKLNRGPEYTISEEPKKGHVFLYKTIFKGYGLNQIIDGNEWKYIIKYQKATQWLYIDDLFLKKED